MDPEMTTAIITGAAAMSAPMSKMIEAVGNVVGKTMHPRYIRKSADAKAYEISTISKALRENADTIMGYDDGKIIAVTPECKEMVLRTIERVVCQELKKQTNIDTVLEKACRELEKETLCSDEPVSPDWMTKFISSVGEISDETMQDLWAKILAGEVVKPKSYSLRTLETLKSLSRDEAELFKKIVPYTLTDGHNVYVAADEKIMEKYGITYGSILKMDDSGLMNAGAFVSANLSVSILNVEMLRNTSKIMFIQGTSERETQIAIRVYKLTQAGKEICEIINSETNGDYLKSIAELVARKNKGKVAVDIYPILSIDNGGISYDDQSKETIQ